jgi:tetratricopeptide (TPR) repeat protein
MFMRRAMRGSTGVGIVLAILALSLAGCGRARRHVSAGNRMYNAGHYQEAIVEYERALELKPDAWTPAFRVAMSYLSLYKPQSLHPENKEYAAGARRALERCLALEAPDAKARQEAQDYYVALLIATQDWEPATQVMEQRLAADPQNSTLVLQLANVYAKRGDYRNSLRYFARRAELEPNDWAAWYTVGVVCWERSYRDPLISFEERERVVAQGLVALERALEIKPKSFDVLAYLNLLHREQAKVHTQAGRHAEAAHDLAEAQEFVKRAQAVRKST